MMNTATHERRDIFHNKFVVVVIKIAVSKSRTIKDRCVRTFDRTFYIRRRRLLLCIELTRFLHMLVKTS